MTSRAGPKLPKSAVSYRRAYFYAARKCGTCVMFEAPDSCTLVAGHIERRDVCDRWEARPGRAASTGGRA